MADAAPPAAAPPMPMLTPDQLLLLTGPVLMAGLLSYFLHGAFTVQLYHYYTHYASNDRRFFVWLVAVVVVIELLHLGLSSHAVYQMLAAGFMNPMVFINTPWSGGALPAINAAGGFCTQLFFAWRIQALTRNTFGKAVAGLILLIAVAQCAGGFAMTVQYSLLNDISKIKQLTDTSIVWLACMLACDTLITVSMVVVLMRAREGTAYSASKNMLNTLIVHTIENGLITTACALALLLVFLIHTQTLLYLCFEFLLGRLYANVLLATLNGRERARRVGDATEHEFAKKSMTGFSGPSNSVQLSGLRTYPGNSGHAAQAVSVTTEVQIDDDGYVSSKNKGGLAY